MSAASGDLQKQYERLALLHEVNALVYATLDPHETLRILLEQSVRVSGAQRGYLAMLNPTDNLLEIVAAHEMPGHNVNLKFRRGEGLAGRVARLGKSICLGDVNSVPYYIALSHDTQSALAVPWLVDGVVHGILNVEADRRQAFSADDQALLEALVHQSANAINNSWRYEQHRLKARLFESLVTVSQKINSAINLDEALKAITHESCQLMQAKMCSILLLDETRQWLDLRASYGAGPAYLKKARLNVSDSLMGVLIRRRKPIQVENVQTSGRYQNVDIARQEGLISLLGVPLVYGGQAIGALNVYTGEPHSFSNEEIRTLSALCDLSAIAIEKARLYERLVDVEEQMRHAERLSALGLLAAEVAHEIRNPLTVMKMLYHSLDLQFKAGDPRATDVRIMGDKMNHLNKIVEQILDFARHTEPALAPVDLNQLINDLCLLTRHKLTSQGIELVRQFTPDLPAIMADATQLEQAFLNLTLNAIQAMPEGGKLRIRTYTAHARDSGARKSDTPLPLSSSTGNSAGAPAQVVIEFKDTGHGMTTEQRRDAFRSLLTTTKAGGTGLGLAIVARLIEAHRGRIKIASRPGRGTCFSILLPIA